MLSSRRILALASAIVLLPFFLSLPAQQCTDRPTALEAGASVAELQSTPTRIGEEIELGLESDGGAPGAKGAESLIWSETLQYDGASYIAPRFSHFDLPEGARLVVRSPEGERSWEYTGTGNGELGTSGGFWGIHIWGDTAIVELFSGVTVDAGVVVIGSFAHGFSDPLGEPEAICGTDDSVEAKCVQTTHPRVYNTSRAVARLIINGINACTGWLVGSAGHLMTNEHCIGTASDAMNTNYEFMAEGATCATNCASPLACGGFVVATTATLEAVDAGLDYALLKLPVNPTDRYGFLQMRNTGTYVGERIYIPQHPAAWGKRIAMQSTHPDDETGLCEIAALDRPACTGGPVDDYGYYCDTQGGSSGSPVLGRCDNAVVALHHCANCPNRGVPIQAIIDDIGFSDLPPNSISTSSWGCDDCGPGWCLGDSFCDKVGCYPIDSPISKAFCQCNLLDPTCGFGSCIGNGYCTGANCQYGVCWINSSPQSQVMCQGMDLDSNCDPF